ncbi:(2Fe-2S)-binding protein [Roseateles toxinivorans]|uniref:Bacterioferritin-associated ferredoxin n=1 Tax=Roseateles toxinivorans TaxID=270368 RepID=A0A4R6QMU9_9BURK|nr:(2Fe-2S)-binding protein [Roseateles toxinivorans]TDP71476.1 bacterioferritin-associated ferredoxin [Roseateles toxinivorans]
MIVCLCHRVSDRDIKRAVANGVHCFEQMQDDCHVASACGACHDCAREVFDEALSGQACSTGHGAGRVINIHAVTA